MKLRSAAAVLAAGCLWGSMGLFVRRLDSYNISSMGIVFIRAAVTALLLFFLLLIFDRRQLKIKLKDLWIFIGCGLVSIAFFNFCYFKAITVMSMSAAAILLYTSPVFVMLFSAGLFKEKITLRKILAIILSLCGLVLVTGVLTDGGGISPKGIMLGIGSAVGYALYSIFSRFAINRGYSSWTITFYPFVFAAIATAFTADCKPIISMISMKTSMALFLLLFAVMVSVLPYILYSWGLKGMENSKAAVIASVEPVAATVFGIAFFGEKLTVTGAAGMALVLCGITLCIEKNSEKKNDN